MLQHLDILGRACGITLRRRQTEVAFERGYNEPGARLTLDAQRYYSCSPKETSRGRETGRVRRREESGNAPARGRK
jgi:hypothetical protein